MLRLLAITLACAATVLAQTGSSEPQYGTYRGGYSGYGGLSAEIYALIQNITVLNADDDMIDATLEDLISMDELNSILRDTFLNEISPELTEMMKKQNQDISELEDKAKSLLTLTDDVAVLNSTINQLQLQLLEIEETRSEIRDRLGNLTAEDGVQEGSLNDISGELDSQEAELTALELRSHAVLDRIGKFRETINDIIDILNTENAQTVDLTLTSDDSEASATIQADFGGWTPNVQYGINSLHISDHSQSYNVYPGYGGYGYGNPTTYGPPNPAIYYEVDVDYNPASNTLVARLYDLSTGGWSVEKVGVTATVFRVDGRQVTSYQG